MGWTRERHAVYMRKYRKKKRQEYRLALLIHYGGNPPKCACCGESIIEFLCIDHIKGNGNKHRRQLKLTNGFEFYAWLVRNKFPKGYQVLCYNCNVTKGIYGKCPHNNRNLYKSCG